MREVNDDASLLENMSPLLQGTVAFAANREWLRKIWWLRSHVVTPVLGIIACTDSCRLTWMESARTAM